MKTLRFWFIVMLLFLLSSCLTVEKKKYVFEFTGKNSGKLTITYYNIFSMMDDTANVSESDFQNLIDNYINGSTIESYFPEAKNFKKRLYVEDGKLCGEITMEFNSLEAVRLMQLGKNGPIVMDLNKTIDGETYDSSNGTYGNPDYMNIVYWPSKVKKIEVVTRVSDFNPDNSVSLVELFNKWK